ncbi:hypothetical protein GLOIN_2v1790588 [Rhizophagus irregularis DAOM 181602=DAOM 197198]|nr:hypothetical protein GLOIN_2v1790588 [Rhizophagus irregularis DAOM 181602=DAOM 197198]
MVVNRDVQNANHRLKHALNLLIHRCRETYEERDILKAERDRSRKERDELQDEFEVQAGLLGLTQDELNIVQDTITGLEANLAELEREFGGMRMTNRRLQQQYNLMRGERNRAIGERDVARNWLVYANNRTIEPSSTSSQPSTKYDMAAVGIAAPIFHGREDEDLNLFIDNFLGYINTVGIDPLDDAGVPPGRVRAMGVLRSCMRDEAARALAVPEVMRRRAGGRPTHQPVNGLGNHGAFMHMRTNFPTVVEERLQIRFKGWDIGEMFYGLQRRQGIEKAKKEELAGYTHPVTPHEGAVMQRSTDVITQERLQELLKTQAEELTKNFQAQFKQLQAFKPVRKPLVYRQQIKPVRPKPQRRVVQDHQDPDWDDGYVDHDVGDDPDAPEWTSEDDQHVIDLIMGYETSKRFPKRLQKAKDRRDDLELARAMRNLDLNDDAMDIDTNTASFDDLKFVPDEEGGFRIFKMTPIKIPVKVTSSKPTLIKAVTKNNSLSLLRSADFRKLLREILWEELKSARKSTEILEDLVEEKQEEDIREDDPMDIDIVRLENTKDLLALDGEVNGIAIQCLADTCANASFIQREAAEELGLDIDKSITHNISGAPGSGRTFGMVKGVSIKLTPDCVITENLAVLSDYKHREIGLSRTCLKRYNYDVHESREHIALTCNEKNVFIPIVSDVNRGDKK